MKIAFLLMFVSLAAIAASAQPTTDPTARVEQFRFTQPAPSVPPAAPNTPTGFKIHYGNTPCPQPCTGAGTYTVRADVALPSKNAAGEYFVNLTITPALASQTLFVAVTAYNAAGESNYSNERSRTPANVRPSAPVLVP